MASSFALSLRSSLALGVAESHSHRSWTAVYISGTTIRRSYSNSIGPFGNEDLNHFQDKIDIQDQPQTTSQIMSTMRALKVSTWGDLPALDPSMPKPLMPPQESPLVQIRVVASGLHQVVRSQSSGKHYSTASATLPYLPGSDGVGIDPEGNLIYFNSIASGGAMAEYINVPKLATFPVPVPASATEEDKKVLAVRIASLFNPAMSSWMALHTRTLGLSPNPTVLILGVTTLSGQIAVKHARYLGAKTVIGVARNEEAMAKLGLDVAIKLEEDVRSTDFSTVLKNHHVDVVLDYLYGAPALHLLNSLPSDARTAHEHPIQYVQIGSVAGPDMDLPSAILRSRNITIRGSGPGAWSVTRDVQTAYPGCLERLCDETAFGNFVSGAKVRRLEDVTAAWTDRTRSVFVI